MSSQNDLNTVKKVHPVAKYTVLVVLFALPLIAYLFFLQGKHHFDKLPVVTQEIASLQGFETVDGQTMQLQDSVTVMIFLGQNPYDRLGYISNLNEKIYREFHEFDDFQLISVVPEDGVSDVEEIVYQMQETTDATDWHFVTGTDSQIQSFFNSFQSNLQLNEDLSSDYAFIIDKNAALRGRDENDEDGAIYGYDTSSIAALQKVMVDDMRVLLAEYRFAFKESRDQKIEDDE
jgi:hypothetical protein